MLAAIVFIATLVRAVWYAPDVEVAPSGTLAQHKAPAVADIPTGDYPVRLQIPSLSIDANIQRVGIAASGRMAVPSNYSDVAWYKYGPQPGELGSAVIDGHVDNGLGLDGVFKHLGDIQVGDDLYVRTKSGATLRFAVSDIQDYPYQQVPTDLIFNQKDGSRLNLITCEGNWVAGDKTYDKRLVVFATLKQST